MMRRKRPEKGTVSTQPVVGESDEQLPVTLSSTPEVKSYLVVTGTSPTGSPWAQNKSRAIMANFDFFAHLVL
ncbi:hypothetical protein BRARA_A01746 [Brassica rapa]|uniref:Uncharacterized protein n=2 Tax=Brassica campestris TaxID=3711 RepID=A0A398ATP1_BRACM|nr:hypothetical protein IGI04_001735 [Brassica rapa subsp. trilocularis]RID78970.1 hypothetical protein BRARA_A01746 [Brassica rapa]